MAELLQEYGARVPDRSGAVYLVRAFAEDRKDGTWVGWLEYVPVAGGAALRTDRETTQPDRQSVAYWASGLEPIYLEGALERARPVSST
jgi:hypothetical protein